MLHTLFHDNHAADEIMVEPGDLHDNIIRLMRFACRVTKVRIQAHSHNI